MKIKDKKLTWSRTSSSVEVAVVATFGEVEVEAFSCEVVSTCACSVSTRNSAFG
jgi:hypothetical protein